jgi:hypothetical protein
MPTADAIWDKARYWHTVGVMLADLGVPAERARTLRASIDNMPEATQALFYHAAPLDVLRDLTGVDTWTPEMVERSRQVWRAAPTNQEMAESMARLREWSSVIDSRPMVLWRRSSPSPRVAAWLLTWAPAAYTVASVAALLALDSPSPGERILMGTILVMALVMVVREWRDGTLRSPFREETTRRSAVLQRRDD